MPFFSWKFSWPTVSANVPLYGESAGQNLSVSFSLSFFCYTLKRLGNDPSFSGWRIGFWSLMRRNVPIPLKNMDCVITQDVAAKIITLTLTPAGESAHYERSSLQNETLQNVLETFPLCRFPRFVPAAFRRRKIFFFLLASQLFGCRLAEAELQRAGRKVRHLTSRQDVGMRGWGPSTPWLLYERQNPSRGRACGRRT